MATSDQHVATHRSTSTESGSIGSPTSSVSISTVQTEQIEHPVTPAVQSEVDGLRDQADVAAYVAPAANQSVEGWREWSARLSVADDAQIKARTRERASAALFGEQLDRQLIETVVNRHIFVTCPIAGAVGDAPQFVAHLRRQVLRTQFSKVAH